MQKVETGAFIRLVVDVWGLVRLAQEGQNISFEINSEKNISTVEYELINHGGSSSSAAPPSS